MKYSFSEAAQHKQMVFADLREKGEIKLSFVPFQAAARHAHTAWHL